MRFYGLSLGIFAVWRITHLLAAEDGPGEILAWLRRRAGDGFWGRLLDCFYCLSLWAAAPVAWRLARGAAGGRGGWELDVLLWLALSAGAVLLERLTRPLAGGGGVPMPIYREDPGREDGHVMLRQGEEPRGGKPARRPPES